MSNNSSARGFKNYIQNGDFVKKLESWDHDSGVEYALGDGKVTYARFAKAAPVGETASLRQTVSIQLVEPTTLTLSFKLQAVGAGSLGTPIVVRIDATTKDGGNVTQDFPFTASSTFRVENATFKIPNNHNQTWNVNVQFFAKSKETATQAFNVTDVSLGRDEAGHIPE